MKVQVDSTKCDAYGLCADAAPQVFELDDFGYAAVRNGGVVQDEDKTAVEEAIRVCPVQAIRVLEQ